VLPRAWRMLARWPYIEGNVIVAEEWRSLWMALPFLEASLRSLPFSPETRIWSLQVKTDDPVMRRGDGGVFVASVLDSGHVVVCWCYSSAGVRERRGGGIGW
jgi:hypothetical protein